MEKSTPVTVAATERVALKSVGDAAIFEANCSALSGHMQAAELTFAAIVAYAYFVWHSMADNKAERGAPLDRMRAITGLHAGMAKKVNNAIRAITISKLPEKVKPRAAALAFANEVAARCFHMETEQRKANSEKMKAAAAERKAKAEREQEQAIRDARAEGRKQGEKKGRKAATIEALAFTLVGDDGQAEPLTPDEYMELRTHLSVLRTEQQTRKVEAERLERHLAANAA